MKDPDTKSTDPSGAASDADDVPRSAREPLGGGIRDDVRDAARAAARNSARRLKVELDHEAKLSERGWIGIVFGDSKEKPGNVAGMTLVMFILMMGAVLIWYPDGLSLNKKEAVSVVAGFITLTLGYLFGRSSAG